MRINIMDGRTRVAEIDGSIPPASLLINGEVYAYRPHTYLLNRLPTYELVPHYDGEIRYEFD